MKQHWLALLACALSISLHTKAAEPAHSPFVVRGTLPWHNFLSGPTAWDEEDYERYLDRMQALSLNYITFHCYTGGAERYVTYVEPIVRVESFDTLPEATFDTSLTARWGYRPLGISEFAFGTRKLFKLPRGTEAFGARCALLAKDNRDRYQRAKNLMCKVITMAHQRGIQVGLGFEFGILPPEYMSLLPRGAYIAGTGLPDPTHPAALEIFRATLDGLLRDYPEVDWLWLWLHEHTMHVGQPKPGTAFGSLLERDGSLFADATNTMDRFNGVWSLAYIRYAHEYLARHAPRVRLAISGWGGGTQLPNTLRGLDRALPRNIVFTCLNPSQGTEPPLAVLREIAANRPVWSIPWLEGDRSLWHLQPRVALLREQVQLAAQDKLQGVLAIHWRTEETRANLDMFARTAASPATAPTAEEFYSQNCAEQFGPAAAAKISEILVGLDRERTLELNSPEYYPYDPSWGRITLPLRARLESHLQVVHQCVAEATDRKHKSNLQWLADNFEFALLLDEVGRKIEPAYRLKERWLTDPAPAADLKNEVAAASAALAQAPIESLFHTFARRVRSKGELGELSSLNQRLWLQYRDLYTFVSNLQRNTSKKH